MSRHSKNASSAPIFSYHEMQRVDWGSKRARLGRESFRKFDACYLCLQKAEKGLCCDKGHLACKECYYKCLLEQKKDIERESVAYADAVSRLENARKEKNDTEKEAALERIHALQTNFSAKKTSHADKKIKADHFWSPADRPSLDTEKDLPKFVKRLPVCTGEKDHHPLKLKNLYPVTFVGNDDAICPVCTKSLTNGRELVALQPCGHVYDLECANQFLKANPCYVCQESKQPKDDQKAAETTPRWIQLVQDGTGFASKGNAEAVSQVTPSFH